MATMDRIGGGGLAQGGLLRRKPLELALRQADEGRSGLRRSLGLFSLTAIGIGDIIGAGIFVTTGVAAALYAGPGIVFSYIVTGIVAALAALCYAELAGAVPISGSAYTYAYTALGEFIAWIIGWDLMLEYALGSTTVSIGWSSYLGDVLKGLFGITLPKALTASPFAGGVVNLPAGLIILLLTGILVLGTRTSSAITNVIVVVKLAVILFFIVVGATHLAPSHWNPLLPFGPGGILHGASIVFFAYVGFDVVASGAEEARDPGRTLPRAILLSLAVATVLYVLVSGILTGIVSYKTLNVASPVSRALVEIGISWAGTLVAVGALAGLTTVLLVGLYGQSRIFFAMARDGLFPPIFERIHPRFRTPYLSSLILGVVVAALGALTPIDVVVELVNIGTLAAFIIVAAGILLLRRTDPDLPRPFRTPLVPLVPILTIVASLALIVALPGVTIVRFLVWLAVGLLIYFVYSRRHSRLDEAAASLEGA